jgi:ribosome-associated protein
MENDVNFDDASEDDGIEIVSKSQLKRESQAITRLGKKLTELSEAQLADIPLDEPVREAIALAHKIQNKRSALKRHYLFLGKLLRARDTDLIIEAIERIDKTSQVEIQRHHQAERWRDRIIEQGFDAIESFVATQAYADRQKFRQLWRNYSQAKNDSKKTQISRQLYKDLKAVLETAAD